MRVVKGIHTSINDGSGKKVKVTCERSLIVPMRKTPSGTTTSPPPDKKQASTPLEVLLFREPERSVQCRNRSH